MSASLWRSLPRLLAGQRGPQAVSKAFWAAATARSTSCGVPSETLVKSLPVEGLTMLSRTKEEGGVDE
jgi:hypothetical protein